MEVLLPSVLRAAAIATASGVNGGRTRVDGEQVLHIYYHWALTGCC